MTMSSKVLLTTTTALYLLSHSVIAMNLNDTTNASESAYTTARPQTAVAAQNDQSSSPGSSSSSSSSGTASSASGTASSSSSSSAQHQTQDWQLVPASAAAAAAASSSSAQRQSQDWQLVPASAAASAAAVAAAGTATSRDPSFAEPLYRGSRYGWLSPAFPYRGAAIEGAMTSGVSTSSSSSSAGNQNQQLVRAFPGGSASVSRGVVASVIDEDEWEAENSLQKPLWAVVATYLPGMQSINFLERYCPGARRDVTSLCFLKREMRNDGLISLSDARLEPFVGVEEFRLRRESRWSSDNFPNLPHSVTDNAFKRMLKLRVLEVAGKHFTDAVVAGLNQLTHLALGVYDAGNSPYSRQFTNATLRDKTGLTSLVFDGRTGINDLSGLNKLRTVVITYPSGKVLIGASSVEKLALLAYNGLEVRPSDFAGLSALRTLCLVSEIWRDTDLPVDPVFRGLESLELRDTFITNGGLNGHLNLRSLIVRNRPTEFNKEGRSYVTRSVALTLPRLQHFSWNDQAVDLTFLRSSARVVESPLASGSASSVSPSASAAAAAAHAASSPAAPQQTGSSSSSSSASVEAPQKAKGQS
jgi:hypothetical protein